MLTDTEASRSTVADRGNTDQRAGMPTVASAKPQEENPMLAMIRAMATFDPHHLVAGMQKWLPQPAVAGFDIAGWTEMQEKNTAALQTAMRQTQAVLNGSANRQLEIMREWLGAAVRATEDTLRADNVFDATAKQVEFAFSTMGHVTLQRIEELKTTAEKIREISNQLGLRCTDAIAEMKKLTSAPGV
jgi:hypothetical protein